MDTCDNCGKLAELYHNELSGLAYCEKCDAKFTPEARKPGLEVKSDERYVQVSGWDEVTGSWNEIAQYATVEEAKATVETWGKDSTLYDRFEIREVRTLELVKP